MTTTTITAEQVKELRERTGAGMMECKKALVAASGDIEVAIEAMRKAGTAKAAKKAGRITAEGMVDAKISTDGKTAAMVEVNCETDFVGRDANFKTFTTQLAQTVLATQVTDINELANATLTGSSQTVEQARQELINKIGENIQVRRVIVVKATDGTIGAYVHGGRIGALVALSTNKPELAKDIAMHVAASNPQVTEPEQVPAHLIEQEKAIFMAQSAQSGKPADIIEKMVTGRISKFTNEISLTGQPFVKDPSKTVGQLLKAEQSTVTQFVRYEVGEGIEKVVEDFAEAVMAQISGDA
jgi:elongation factor Ts